MRVHGKIGEIFIQVRFRWHASQTWEYALGRASRRRVWPWLGFRVYACCERYNAFVNHVQDFLC